MKKHRPEQKRKIIDLISIEISALLNFGGFDRSDKSEFASMLHDHVKKISDKLTIQLEKEKELDENI